MIGHYVPVFAGNDYVGRELLDASWWELPDGGRWHRKPAGGKLLGLYRFQVPTALSGDGTAACAYYNGAACTWKRKSESWGTMMALPQAGRTAPRSDPAGIRFQETQP